MGGGSYLNHHCDDSLLQTFVRAHRCLCNIISAMVAFLNADSYFVRHAAGNILVSISHFLIKHECLWAKLLQLIWFILEDAMSAIFSCPDLSGPAVIHVDGSLMLHERTLGDNSEDQNFQPERFLLLLKSRLLNVNQFMVVHLFQTLRNILKSLKHDSRDLEEVFIQYAVSSLIKMPWDLLFEVYNRYYTSQRSFKQVEESEIKIPSTVTKNLLLGTILQLCCSIVELYNLETDGTILFKEPSVYSEFSDFVPKLLSYCFVNHSENRREFLFDYLKHKSLILMIRLSFHRHWKKSHPEYWLKLINQFFGEILCQSFSGYNAGSENCLEESPFFYRSLEGEKSYARHLQRFAIFLLFKCSFAIACVGKASSECSYKEETSYCHFGLMETFAWLQRSCPLDKFQNCRNYSESCSSFAASFLQFYMEEDDMLFKMLLQLLDAPFSMWQKENSNENGSIGANEDMLCHFCSIFCPIRLFHLFLHLIQYDCLFLVDHLMSKDTGLWCLQYLLRCLRLICESWPAFMQFSIFGNESDHHYEKKRKIPIDGDESLTLLSSTITFRRQAMCRHKNFQCAYEVSGSHAFENAKECLHSLKISLGELQRKSLFPYNSKPLLRSLDRFLELCST